VAGPCERGNEPSGSVKGGEFFHCPSYYQLLRKDCDPRSWLVGWLVS